MGKATWAYPGASLSAKEAKVGAALSLGI
jgi:hypothetical protein